MKVHLVSFSEAWLQDQFDQIAADEYLKFKLLWMPVSYFQKTTWMSKGNLALEVDKKMIRVATDFILLL